MVVAAIREGDLEELERLVKNGYEFNRCLPDNQPSPLQEAVLASNPEVLKVHAHFSDCSVEVGETQYRGKHKVTRLIGIFPTIIHDHM